MLTITSFDRSAIADRARSDSSGASAVHQISAWVSSKSLTRPAFKGVDHVLRRAVEVRGHPQSVAQPPRSARRLGHPDRNQLDEWLAVLGNDHLLAGQRALDKPRQRSLGFVHVDGR